MYVTDYTPRQDLVSSTESWAAGLDGYILKIILRDNQFEAVKSAQAGAICTIKKLRLKQSTTNLQIQGQLGGEERLIFILDTTYEGADGNVDNLKQCVIVSMLSFKLNKPPTDAKRTGKRE